MRARLCDLKQRQGLCPVRGLHKDRRTWNKTSTTGCPVRTGSTSSDKTGPVGVRAASESNEPVSLVEIWRLSAWNWLLGVCVPPDGATTITHLESKV